MVHPFFKSQGYLCEFDTLIAPDLPAFCLPKVGLCCVLPLCFFLCCCVVFVSLGGCTFVISMVPAWLGVLYKNVL